MGFYIVNHSGSTKVNKGSEKEPDMKLVPFAKGKPVEDLKKGDLDHIEGAEYHSGDPKEGKDYLETEKK